MTLSNIGSVSMSVSLKQETTGTPFSGGPKMVANCIATMEDHMSGWAYGGITYVNGDFLNIHLVDPEGPLGAAYSSMPPGFSPTGKPVIGLAVWIKENNTIDSAASLTHLSGTGAGLSWYLSHPGDMFLSIDRGSTSVLVHSATGTDTDEMALLLLPEGGGSIPANVAITFAVLVIYG